MRLGGWIITLALTIGITPWSQAFSSELIARPVFTADREFAAAADENATHLIDPTLPIDLWIYDRALKRCELKADSVRGKLSAILDQNSSLWDVLNRLFPNSRNQVATLKLRVVIDDFSDFSGKSAAFSSYFTDLDGPTIGLDCQSIERSYWLRSLAHEMTHALLYQKGVQSGFEEGLAQLIEHFAGGEQPELTLKHLQVANTIPTALEDQRPLRSRESYAVQYLFVSYIRQEFGGWPTLQAMADTDPALLPKARAHECAMNPEFLSQAACRAHALLSASSPGSFAEQKMTRDGLLRYFYMALAMNNSQSSHYQILGWNGFSKLPVKPATEKLVPGQAAIFTDTEIAKALSSRYETYCISIQSDKSFQIAPISESDRSDSVTKKPDERSYNYCLAINLSEL